MQENTSIMMYSCFQYQALKVMIHNMLPTISSIQKFYHLIFLNRGNFSISTIHQIQNQIF